MTPPSFPIRNLPLLPIISVLENANVVDIIELAEISTVFFKKVKNACVGGIRVTLMIGKDSTYVLLSSERSSLSERITFCFEDTQFKEQEDQTRFVKLGTLNSFGSAVFVPFGSSLHFRTTDRHQNVAQLMNYLGNLFPRVKIYASVPLEHVSDVGSLRIIFKDIRCNELSLSYKSEPIGKSEQVVRKVKIHKFLPMVKGVKKLTLNNYPYEKSIHVKNLKIEGEWVRPKHIKNWNFVYGEISNCLFTTKDFARFINSWKAGASCPSMKCIEISHKNVYDERGFDGEAIAELVHAQLYESKWNENTFNVKRYDGKTARLTIGRYIKLEVCD